MSLTYNIIVVQKFVRVQLKSSSCESEELSIY